MAHGKSPGLVVQGFFTYALPESGRTQFSTHPDEQPVAYGLLLVVRPGADLQPPRAEDALTPLSMVVLGAARLGRTRLIDNFEI